MASFTLTNNTSTTLLKKTNMAITLKPPRVKFPTKPCKISMKTSSLTRPKETKKPVPQEKLESWMRDSVSEIVNNLRASPLLVRVYEDDKVVLTQKAAREDWEVIRENWETKESVVPEGVILVEELIGEECDGDGDGDSNGVTRAWGIVVQGRGCAYGPLCYLLKTSRVGSGMGFGCTHFCLVKVNNFRETALSQFKNCWLLQGQ